MDVNALASLESSLAGARAAVNAQQPASRRAGRFVERTQKKMQLSGDLCAISHCWMCNTCRVSEVRF